ncbi:Endo-1,4-beta-xylanase Z [bioreactor metagenome]|uniref:endo-1,4-beta-xylanase n=1 Tax=bioreactor metagenome TaxID=1076179 RepID=A0A644XT53_9ZZZZ
MNHFKDNFFAYNVVNEFYATEDNDGQDIMLKVIGKDYIDIAFETVRKTDPTAITVLNQAENHTLNWEVNGTNPYQTTLRVAKRLKEKGLLDMVGSQCHVDFGPGSPAYTNIAEMTQVYKSYPVPVFISELDANTEQYASQPDRFLIQTQRVKGVLQAALDSGSSFFNLWGGFPDELGWLGPQAASTPWATGWVEKSMYFEILRNLFKNYAKVV